MELHLLKALLNKEIYNTYINLIPDTLFTDEALTLFKALKNLKVSLSTDLTVPELSLYFYTINPTLTTAQKHLYETLFQKLILLEPISYEVAEKTFMELLAREQIKQVIETGLKVIQGEPEAKSKFSELISVYANGTVSIDNAEPVDMSVDDLLIYAATKGEFQINVPELNQYLPGLDRGTFTIIFARPEVGKTAAWVTLVAAPKGFLDQQKKVLVVLNEEPARRSLLRCVHAASGISLDVLSSSPHALDKAREIWAAKKGYLHLYDAVGMTLNELEYLVKKIQPDIVIVDNMDKVRISGSFAREDQYLKALYVHMREILKRNHCAGIAVSQASAEAEDRKILTLDMLENSRTGKAAEADVIIGIGKVLVGDQVNSPIRHAYFCKNKLTGAHEVVNLELCSELSSYYHGE